MKQAIPYPEKSEDSMKKKNLLRGCLLTPLGILILLSGWIIWAYFSSWLPINQLEKYAVTSNPTVLDTTKLTSSTIINAKEILALQASPDMDEIVAVYQDPNDMNLLVLHQSGLFYRWDMNLQTITAKQDFNLARRYASNFNFDGSQVITPAKLINPDEYYGYFIWDVKTGKQLLCSGDLCSNPTSYFKNFESDGLILSPNSKWVVEYSGPIFTAETTFREEEKLSNRSVDWDDFDRKYFTIDQIAFDLTGTYLAVSTKEGIIRVYNIEYVFFPEEHEELILYETEQGIHVRSLERKYGGYNSNQPIHTIDLKFDDTRTWLARLTDSSLIVYDLRKMIFPKHLELPLLDGNLMTFNHSGKLLVVATNKEIIVFNPETKKQITTIDISEEVSAMFFTHDDHFLIYGDKNGIVHVLGIQ